MIGYFQDLYKQMKREYLGVAVERIPEEYHSQFVCVGGASEISYQMDKCIPASAQSVLIVGVYGGRDYFYFKEKGKSVFAVDLFEDKRFENISVCDVQGPLPFPDQYFDVVIIAEVLEHLFFDVKALMNIRKVLSDEGALLITVPFYHDRQDTHVRMHSIKTIERLLSATGFRIEKKIERPSLFFAPRSINIVHHAINAFFFLLTGKTLYRHTLPKLWMLDTFLGRCSIPGRRFMSMYGALFQCCKDSSKVDYKARNISEYRQSTSSYDRN